MGLVAPITMKAKILIRKRWTNSTSKLGWDDSLSKNECEEWKRFFEDMYDAVTRVTHNVLYHKGGLKICCHKGEHKMSCHKGEHKMCYVTCELNML